MLLAAGGHVSTDPKTITPDGFNKLIDQTIKAIVDERFSEAVEGLQDLAQLMRTGGQPAQSFVDLATYIENEAVERSKQGEAVRIMLKRALHEARVRRNGHALLVPSSATH